MTDTADEYVEVQIGPNRWAMRKRSTLEAPRRHPKASDIYSAPEVVMKGRQYHLGKPYTARQVPLHHPDAPHHDEMGRAVFTTAQEEIDFMAKTGATNDGRSIEKGEYTQQLDRDKKKAKELPHEDTWQRVRKKAQDEGLLPRKGEPRTEMKRRQKEVLKSQDKALKKKRAEK